MGQLMQTVQSIPIRTRAENAADVIDRLRALGIESVANSRLMTMKRVLDRGVVSYDDLEFAIALESIRDLQHIGFALSVLKEHPDTLQFRDLIKRLILDSELPQDDLINSDGRDAQLELYLAAICQNAGMLPVNVEEPDVTCFIDEVKFGIAAKRIKSRKQARSHIRKATEQIQRSGYPGIIVLDLSFAWNRNNRPVHSQLERQLFPIIALANSNKFFESQCKSIELLTRNTGTRGVMVLDYLVAVQSDGTWGHEGMMTWMPTVFDDACAKHEFDLFYESFLRGFPKLIDLVGEYDE